MNDMIKMIDGQECVSVAGIILLSVMALSDGVGNAQRAADTINGLVRASKDKGYTYAEAAIKILMRGVVDDFTRATADEVAQHINAQDLLRVLHEIGFPMAGVSVLDAKRGERLHGQPSKT